MCAKNRTILLDSFICYKQKCEVVSFNLSHPVHYNTLSLIFCARCTLYTSWLRSELYVELTTSPIDSVRLISVVHKAASTWQYCAELLTLITSSAPRCTSWSHWSEVCQPPNSASGFTQFRRNFERSLVYDYMFVIHSFIHSYSFIFSCQNATKHELGDAINSRLFNESTILL